MRFFAKVLIHDLETQPVSLPFMGSNKTLEKPGMYPFLGPQWHWCCANLTGHRAYFGKRDFGWSEFCFLGKKSSLAVKPTISKKNSSQIWMTKILYLKIVDHAEEGTNSTSGSVAKIWDIVALLFGEFSEEFFILT